MKPNMKRAKIRTDKKVNTTFMPEFTNEQLSLGKGKLYLLKTYGCQMNEHDSEFIRSILESMGYIRTEILEEADLVILNTCAIRENAHNKVFGYLGRVKHEKGKKDVVVGISGCMPQQETVTDLIEEKYKWIDFVLGTHNIHELPSILEKSVNDKKQEINVYSIEGDIVENLPYKRDSKYKGWVNIMYGCNNFCTYCIVPYTRGKQRSRESSYIVSEVENLIKEGYKEITLLGQNVNSYGLDLENESFPKLLQSVANTNIERIRFVTSNPWDFTDDIIEVIKNNKNIMPYIHLPIQSGSNKILKLMGRKYTRESYIELFNKLKNNIPSVSITTDIIVGFPGETEEDFNDTLDIVNTCEYAGAFTFIFSKREGTPAAKLEDNVTLQVKEERLQTLNELINKYSNQNNKKYLDKIVPVLVESVSEKDDTMLMGYTDTMKLVNFKGDKSDIGSIVNVKITDVKTWSMDGIKI